MQISIIKEQNTIEQRVAGTPESLKNLFNLGAEVLVEKGAGLLSGFDVLGHQAVKPMNYS